MKKIKTGQQFEIPNTEILEVLDSNNKPLLIMPRQQAVQQRLPLRVVLIVVRNQEGKIYIHKRSNRKSTYGGTWAVSAAGYVQAGESLEEAALRELAEELSITNVAVRLAAVAYPSPSTDNSLSALFLTNPAYVLITPDPAEIASGMFVDREELASMLREMPELIAPALRWAAYACDLFVSA